MLFQKITAEFYLFDHMKLQSHRVPVTCTEQATHHEAAPNQAEVPWLEEVNGSQPNKRIVVTVYSSAYWYVGFNQPTICVDLFIIY